MKVALVTGAGRRLGRELALALGNAGYTLGVHYRSERETADETLGLLRKAGGDGAVFRADLTEPDAAKLLAEAMVTRFGRLDALVHSASVWIDKPIDAVSGEDWDRTFSVGPRAAFFLAQGAREALGRSEGAILLISDVAATKAWPRHIPHVAAKAALDALVRNLAVALAPGIRVNGLAPGIVLPPEDLPRAEVDRLVARTPLRRVVPVEDLVSMAIAVIENRSMTGQVVAVDAGRAVV